MYAWQAGFTVIVIVDTLSIPGLYLGGVLDVRLKEALFSVQVA